jgi:hypothetical protein
MAETEQYGIFTSLEHKQRFVQVIQDLGKVYNGKLDPEYAAALYILTSHTGTWNKAQQYVDKKGHGIDFPTMIEDRDWSGGYGVLIKWASNLFNGETHIDPLELLRLDEANFGLALTALWIRRHSLQISDLLREA